MSVANFDERELRIAPVMTGGTSLAIWMGGATLELYRVLRGRTDEPVDVGDRIYRGLLEATRTTAVVDVITGTSAGGLNGTLLGAAWVLDLPAADYLATRQTWLDLADLEALMRPTSERHPPSLLRGDDYFAAKLRAVLDQWSETHTTLAPDHEVDMVTTVTTVVSEPRSRVDHFGESLSEVDHAQWLRFTTEDFHAPRWTEKLAIAARTSASIPGVFEPSYLPMTAEHAQASGRPSFEGNASFTGSRWAVDGGTVVNLPLGEALDRIYAQTAHGDVRRVVLYVCPTPGEPRTASADEPDRRPTIATSLLTVVTAPRAEGISADVDQLDRHNAAVERQARVRRTMARLVDLVLGRVEVVVGRGDGVTVDDVPPAARALAGAAGEPFALYRAQRAEASVHQMIERVRGAVGPIPLDPAELEAVFGDARMELVPERVDLLSGPTASWGWGIAPVEEAVSIGLGLVARSQRLQRADTDRDVVTALREAKRRIHAAREVASAVRTFDEAFWEGRFATMPGLDERTGRIDPARFDRRALEAWAAESYQQWPVEGDAEARLATFLDLAAAHLQVANTVIDVFPAIVAVTTACGAVEPASLTAEDDVVLGSEPGAAATAEAAAFAQAILDEAAGLLAAGSDPRLVQRQLLRVHVAQTLLLGEVESREQHIDLMQLSWSSWNALDPDRAPADKLAGPELARLGAFLKPSWRANDWMWGRMDAAHRLVLLLLDPARLAQMYPSVAAAQEALESSTGVVLPPDAIEELAYLDHRDSMPVPRTLTATTKAFARVVQTQIARVELPIVAEAVRTSERRGANAESSRAFAAAVPPAAELLDPTVVDDEHVAALVKDMKIGRESVRQELGYSLMNRTISQGAAVAVNALTGTEAGVPVVANALRPLRVPLHAVNSVVSVMTSGTRLARGLTAFVLAAAGALLALALLGNDVPAGSLAVAAILFIGAVVVAMFRSGFGRIGVIAAAGGVVIALALIGDDMASLVFTTEAPTTDHHIDEGSTLVLGDDVVLRVTRGDGSAERIDDLEAGGGTVVVRNGSAEVRGEPAADHEAGWKRWGFIAAFSVARVLCAVGAVVLLVRVWRRDEGRPIAGAALGAAVLALLTAAMPWLAELVLTGDEAGAGPAKDGLVTAAERLGAYSIEVVVLILVAIGVAIGLGADLLLRRASAGAIPTSDLPVHPPVDR